MGCEIGGRGEEDAVFQMRKKAMHFKSISADKTSRVFGVAEIDAGVLLPIASSPTAGRAAGQHV